MKKRYTIKNSTWRNVTQCL